MALQIERSLSTAARLADIPALGEPIWDTQEEQLYIGDGVTLGGKLSVQAAGIEPQQASRLNAVDYRATKSMHQTVKLMDLGHWSNNLVEILGSNFGSDDHHTREGVYCLRTREPGQGNNGFRLYYPGSAFYLPAYSFVNGRYIDWYASFDFPNAPGNVGFRIGLIVDPDGSETAAAVTAQALAWVDLSGISPASVTGKQVEVHVRIHAEGTQRQSSYNLRAERFNKDSGPLPEAGETYTSTVNRRLSRSIDMTVPHRVAVGVLNQSGDATEVSDGYYTSTASNYEELRMLSTSAWMFGGGRTN